MSIRYEEAETETAHELLVQADKAVLFWEKMNQLGDECQKLMRMTFEERSESEIKAAFGFSNEGSVKVKRHKCKGRLMELIMRDPRFVELKD